MDKSQIAAEIRQILRRELDDVETYIKKNEPKKALSELDDAVRKLKRLLVYIET